MPPWKRRKKGTFLQAALPQGPFGKNGGYSILRVPQQALSIHSEWQAGEDRPNPNHGSNKYTAANRNWEIERQGIKNLSRLLKNASFCWHIEITLEGVHVQHFRIRGVSVPQYPLPFLFMDTQGTILLYLDVERLTVGVARLDDKAPSLQAISNLANSLGSAIDATKLS